MSNANQLADALKASRQRPAKVSLGCPFSDPLLKVFSF